MSAYLKTAYEPINLDSLDADDLDACFNLYSALAEYAKHAIRARKARLEGRIVAAQVQEDTMNRIYAKLPDWGRW